MNEQTNGCRLSAITRRRFLMGVILSKVQIPIIRKKKCYCAN